MSIQSCFNTTQLKKGGFWSGIAAPTSAKSTSKIQLYVPLRCYSPDHKINEHKPYTKLRQSSA